MGYLLKPINRDHLTETVADCINKIDESRMVSKAMDDLKKAHRSMQIRAIRDAINGHIEDSDNEFFDNKESPAYMCVALAVSKGNPADLRKEFEKHISDCSCLKFVFKGELHNSSVLYFESDNEDLALTVKKTCMYLANNYNCSIGVGNVCVSHYDLNISYTEALFASESRSFIPESCISISEIEKLLDKNEENIAEMASIINRGEIERIEPFFKKLVEKKNMVVSYMGIDIKLNEPNFALTKAYFVNLIEKAADKNNTGINTALLYTANQTHGQ